MSFERSARGQANRAIFLGVDWIIYTEGGTFTKEAVRSYDATFWSGAFKALNPDQKFRAIPKGGKRNLLELAEEVMANEVKNVIVAIDLDYDDFFDRLIDHPKIVYTHGYSYENDIYDARGLEDLFCNLCNVQAGDVEVKESLDKRVDSFVSAVRWPLKFDLVARYCDVKGFDRDRCQKYFQSSAYGAEPVVSRDRVVAETQRISSELGDRKIEGKPLPTIGSKNIFGHFWEVFVFRLLTALQVQKCGGQKLTYEAVRSFSISRFQVRLLQNDPLDDLSSYYRRIVAQAVR